MKKEYNCWEWRIIEDVGLPEKSGKYGILYRYTGGKKQVYTTLANFISNTRTWVEMVLILGKIEILAWCEFPAIPSRYLI